MLDDSLNSSTYWALEIEGATCEDMAQEWSSQLAQDLAECASLVAYLQSASW